MPTTQRAGAAALVAATFLVTGTGLRAAEPAKVLAAEPSKLGVGAPNGLQHLKGRWVGEGVAELKNGRQEPFKCIATYFQNPQGSELKHNLRCESPNVRMAVTALMQISGGAIVGTWHEKQYEIEGRVNGNVTTDGIRMVIGHQSKEATMELTATNCEQKVVVAPGADEIVRLVTASLKRC